MNKTSEWSTQMCVLVSHVYVPHLGDCFWSFLDYACVISDCNERFVSFCSKSFSQLKNWWIVLQLKLIRLCSINAEFDATNFHIRTKQYKTKKSVDLRMKDNTFVVMYRCRMHCGTRYRWTHGTNELHVAYFSESFYQNRIYFLLPLFLSPTLKPSLF